MSRLLRIEELDSRRSTSREKGRQHQDILVVGQTAEISLSNLAPSDAVFVTLDIQGEIEVKSKNNEALATRTPLRLDEIAQEITLLARTYSDELRDRSLQITFRDQDEKFISRERINLTAVRVCLDVDADRDGVIEENNPNKADWKWGKEGHGAILLVNSDQDTDSSDPRYDSQENYISGLIDLRDFSFMVIRKVGPRYLPSGCELNLSVNRDTARRIRIFNELDRNGYELIGPSKRRANMRDTDREILLAMEGLSYPDIDFDGMLEINLNLLQDGEIIYSDKVVFRVAPWLMTPGTLPPKTVYVSRLSDGFNEEFIEDLRKVVGQANAQLETAAFDFSDDPWMQDEIEIGYTEAPGQLMYVVLDSPRDRGLDDFPEIKLLGTDFGYVKRGSRRKATKLDSFGNLEVSPPVTVDGIEYPFGRIIFGGTRRDVFPEDSRRMLKVLRDFFYAQKIQAPLEIFSDWLSVGHIDEFMTFVSAPTPKGFKLLLVSSDKCYEILRRLQNEGHGELFLREGKRFKSGPADISVNEVLASEELAEQNRRFTEHINWNREVLKRELGLGEEDIIEIPGLFEDAGDGRAETFFPNMVNMIVLNKHLGIPKPFGPRVNGECQFEAYVRSVLSPLDLVCHFIDDWDPYFRGRGEIHCGTNTRRQPFAKKWWEVESLHFAEVAENRQQEQ